jgi:hypothetical protein
MRRRFGRGRKTNAAQGKRVSFDAARCFERIVEEKIVAARSLAVVTLDESLDDFAAVAAGEADDGGKLVVAFAPRNGGDAALAGLVYAQSLVDNGGFDGEVVAVCPQWSIAARQRLARLAAPGLRFRAVVASSLAEGDNSVELRLEDTSARVPARRIADRLQGSIRDLFLRALASLEGLAAKHRGAVRGVGDRVELVLLARRVASIRAQEAENGEGQLVLETFLPDRATERLQADQLAVVLDRLEGSLRKRLNDRRIRSSDEGLRAQLLDSLAEAEGIRRPIFWPLAGSDAEVLDFAGLDANGSPVIAVVRSRLSVPELGAILDGVNALEPTLPALFADADAPVRLGSVQLLLAASEFDSGALAALSMLSLDHRSYDILIRRGRDPELQLRSSGSAGSTPLAPRPAAAARVEPETGELSEPRPALGRRRRGRRGGSQRQPRDRSDSPEERESSASDRPKAGAERSASRFEEVSVFDLDDASGADSSDGARRPKRGRRRSRRGRSGSGESTDGRSDAASREGNADDSEGDSDGGLRPSSGRGRKREVNGASNSWSAIDDVDDDDELADSLVLPVADVEEPSIEIELDYEDENGFTEEAVLDDAVETAVAELGAEEPEAEPESAIRRPRRRCAIVVHADRGSLIAALLLARDLRLVEGIWVYSQSELMTFFRSVATDLHEETPIYVVGFTASPARDTIQAASLYADRIAWFDHHDWPPEDLENLRSKIGDKNVNVTAGAESSIPAVLVERSRRSRFSDKIVELATGRFSQHDYERWGRVWWQRLGEYAEQSGNRRADIEPLLVGRPSDLAREVEGAPIPPPPPEVEFISGRDFRLVHFGGYRMVVVPTPASLDLHLATRVARERYEAELSLGFTEGEDVMVLGGDDALARRNLDLLSMASHLVLKHDWIEALPATDYVARVRIPDFAANPDRLDEVIGEIAMGRSILEG